MNYRCIGHKTGSKQCERTSSIPTNPNKPEWGWLCDECADEPPRANSSNRKGFSILDRDDDKPNTIREDLSETECDFLESRDVDVDVFA